MKVYKKLPFLLNKHNINFYQLNITKLDTLVKY